VTPVKRAKVEYRLVVSRRHGKARAYGKRDLAHARKDAEAYENNPDKSTHIESRTVTAWTVVKEE